MASGALRLLDPRWHWLRGALDRLYAELDGQAVPVSLTVGVAAGQELLFYVAEPGVAVIGRRVITDLEQAAAITEACTVDISPEDVTG